MKKLMARLIILIVLFTLLSSIAPAWGEKPDHPIIVLLTDFGESDFYVGVMKGVIFSINHEARVETITNQVEPFNVKEGAYILENTYPYYPRGTIFLVIVDPEVGSSRKPLLLETGDGKYLVGPDNGLFTMVLGKAGLRRAYELTSPRYWRTKKPSSTFQGRDIFSSAAAHLSLGVPPEKMGKPTGDLVRLPLKKAALKDGKLEGEVTMVDYYGNLLTNIPGELLRKVGLKEGDCYLLETREQKIKARLVRTYSDVPLGEYLFLVNSEGLVEVARNLTNAAKTLGIRAGAGLS
ncbi:MAG: S-adenosyl-l-methionine hydroxide adenosyltransferase family protein, partial [Syntrophales bacterium]|nr:S-adenosyl-l-methionine hydroxide adenosyltransferase family protein [Syntrophales bacterium]